MNQQSSQMQYQIKESISQFKTEIAKFINNPYHSIKEITKLHGKLTKLEIKIDNNELTNYGNSQSNTKQELFLPILQKYNPDTTKTKNIGLNNNIANFNNEKNHIKNSSARLLNNNNRLFHIRKRLPENEIITHRRKMQNEKIKNEVIINKYGLNKNDEVVNVRERSFSLNKKNLIKITSAHPSFRKPEYNKYNKPILIKDDFKGGLFEMVNRGLIPKNADLSMAFAKNGNPFKLNIPDDDIKENQENKYNTNNIIYQIEKNDSDKQPKYNSSLFLTGTKDVKNNNKDEDILNITASDEKNNNDLHSMINTKQTNKHHLNQQTSSEDMFKFLIFKEFKVFENKEFTIFKSKNIDKWSLISYFIKVLEKLFKTLNVTHAEVDCEKLKRLCNDELKAITKMDLIQCLSDPDIKLKGFNKASKLFATVKDASAVTIQKISKGFLVRRRFKQMKSHHKKICRIQTFYRLYRIINISKSLIQDKLNEQMEQWQIMMNELRENWSTIKTEKRVEIHINSMSFNSDTNCTISKFTEKQNNQLCRLINLKDPNVEIIYVTPYELPEDVIKYYFSILSTIGVQNVQQRVTFITPEANKILPPNFNLASMLYYSTASCKKIMSSIEGKRAYIVPGKPSSSDMRLSLYLECPILHIENEASNMLFTKSGAKRVFELNDLATPIGEWDIHTRDSLFSKLASLITNYSSIDIWILKIDNEFSGRGTAFFQINHSKHLVDLKKDRQSGSIDSDKYEMMVENILRSILHKKMEIVCKNVYRSGEEFINELVKRGGIIEACPTYLLSGIIGSPTISFLIEPNGEINNYFSYDRISANSFTTIAAYSPQNSIPNLVRALI